MDCNGEPKRKISYDDNIVALRTIGTTATTAFAKETPPGIAEHADGTYMTIREDWKPARFQIP
jgi:hypothetical protein